MPLDFFLSFLLNVIIAKHCLWRMEKNSFFKKKTTNQTRFFTFPKAKLLLIINQSHQPVASADFFFFNKNPCKDIQYVFFKKKKQRKMFRLNLNSVNVISYTEIIYLIFCDPYRNEEREREMYRNKELFVERSLEIRMIMSRITIVERKMP